MDPQTKDKILGHLDTASEIANAVKGNRGASLRSQLDPARKLVAAEPTGSHPNRNRRPSQLRPRRRRSSPPTGS